MLASIYVTLAVSTLITAMVTRPQPSTPPSAQPRIRNNTLIHPRQGQSAWNGQRLPDSSHRGPDFGSFYVPPGSRFIDDTDPSITYKPKQTWKQYSDSSFVSGTSHATDSTSASLTVKFVGTGIQWFGSTGPSHGIVVPTVDGRTFEDVATYSKETVVGQRLFGIANLPRKEHTLVLRNTRRKTPQAKGHWFDVDAFVIDEETAFPTGYKDLEQQDGRKRADGGWELVEAGDTGVGAMQIAVLNEQKVLIVDKVEHNPLSVDGHPAWAALYNIPSQTAEPLRLASNSFCAGGSFLSNGTLVNVGGNPVVADRTGAADFGDVDGLQAIRLVDPCPNFPCEIYESSERLRLATPRWYNSVVRLEDGSVMIVGGSTKGGWINNRTTNNPTYEFFPPKDIHGNRGTAIPLPFLSRTLNSNLFPIIFALPDGRIFMAANQDAMIYDWKNQQEYQLPQIPNGVRVTYPMSGTGLLLPLSPSNGYAPEILLCGGSAISDTRPGYEIDSQEDASNQCSRLLLTEEGIQRGWEVEQMPEARVMPSSVILPTGQVLILNGARSGIAGYGNVKNQVGQSNADNPVLTPVLYDPSAPVGSRFSSDGMPTSRIPRLYHSVATLTADGSVMIAGSNPNLDRSSQAYQTEYRVEWLRPPYMYMARPSISGVPTSILFGEKYTLRIEVAKGGIVVSVMDFGFITHAVNMNTRMVILEHHVSEDRKSITITGPPSPKVYPPGPGFLFIVVEGVPSSGQMIMVGDGRGPPEDAGAAANLLASTMSPDMHRAPSEMEGGGEGSGWI